MEIKYTVCHDCQLTGGGIRHCAHPNECGNTKQYPQDLRDMIEVEFYKKTPLSIIAEKAFDLGIAHALNI